MVSMEIMFPAIRPWPNLHKNEVSILVEKFSRQR